MKRINIALSEKTYLRVKVIAAIKGLSMNEYLVSCLERHAKPGPGSKTIVSREEPDRQDDPEQEGKEVGP